MNSQAEPLDTVLVVEDEDSVRRTVQEWLGEPDLRVRVLAAADSESALLLANQYPIDLAILDWNLGAGLNGLDLLQDLADFHPNIVAIMMTAYADQATPLDAMRRGVRDYLDKNHELTRENFLAAVRRQLQYLRPAKRERQFHENLLAFRNAVEKALPLVESVAALNDPVSLPEAIGSLFRFLLNVTRASDGVLFVRQVDADCEPPEVCRVFGAHGRPLEEQELIPFPQSIAASAISVQEPCAMTGLRQGGASGALALQPFERDHFSLLAAPLAVAPGVHVVLELFDKRGPGGEIDPKGFSEADVRLVRDAGEFGAEMLRQYLAQRQSHRILLDAVGAAIRAGESVARTIGAGKGPSAAQPAPTVVLDQIRESLGASGQGAIAPSDTVRLAEAIRVLAARHGAPAVRHCIQLVEGLRQLLDTTAGL